jgi:hypothetical protein
MKIMFVYEYQKKIFHKNCFIKGISKAEQQRGNKIDGNEFIHRFPGGFVRCAGCGSIIEYSTLTKTTEYSLGEYDEEED